VIKWYLALVRQATCGICSFNLVVRADAVYFGASIESIYFGRQRRTRPQPFRERMHEAPTGFWFLRFCWPSVLDFG
jgi:hypothetical protein